MTKMVAKDFICFDLLNEAARWENDTSCDSAFLLLVPAFGGTKDFFPEVSAEPGRR